MNLYFVNIHFKLLNSVLLPSYNPLSLAHFFKFGFVLFLTNLLTYLPV